jgi:hypothetical protein
MARKQHGFPVDQVERKTTVGRFADPERNLMVTTTTTVEWTPLHVAFDDIVKGCVVEPDDFQHEAPWDSCTGYDHTCTKAARMDEADAEEMRGYCWSDAHRSHIVITLNTNHDDAEYLRSCRAAGMSKQTAAEMLAEDRRRRLDQLTTWYEHGWEWWTAGCTFADYSDGVGGIDSLDYAAEVANDCACSVAAEMQADGYIVDGMPEREKLFHGYPRSQFGEWVKRNLERDCWTYEDRRFRARPRGSFLKLPA